LLGLEKHLLEEACLGSISECFEPEAPFRPVCAPAQAWSVAEVFRLRTRLQHQPAGAVRPSSPAQ
jgi:glycogen debranching enzyme